MTETTPPPLSDEREAEARRYWESMPDGMDQKADFICLIAALDAAREMVGVMDARISEVELAAWLNGEMAGMAREDMDAAREAQRVAEQRVAELDAMGMRQFEDFRVENERLEQERNDARRDVEDLVEALEFNQDLAWVYLEVNPEGNLDRELEPKRKQYEASMELLARIRGDHAAEPAAPAPDVAALIEALLPYPSGLQIERHDSGYVAWVRDDPNHPQRNGTIAFGITLFEALQALTEKVK